MLLVLGAQAHAGEPDGRQLTLQAMQLELERSQKGLKMSGHPAPYFTSYTVKDNQSQVLNAKFGAIYEDDERRDREMRVEVRVGSYQLDNSGVDGADFDRVMMYQADQAAPIEAAPAALRASLWLLTDEVYKEALSAFLKKQAKGVFKATKGGASPSFSREEAVEHLDAPLLFDADRQRDRAMVRRLSRHLVGVPRVFDSSVRLGADKQVRYFVSSEGARIVTEKTLFSISFWAATRADDGMLLDHSKTFYAMVRGGLPDERALEAGLATMLTELAALREAPLLDPYTGPALLAPEASGVLFHEAIGHRLEGERQLDEHEGRTFKGQLGQRVLPAFISVLDDPTLRAWESAPLNGHYRFDDQGTRARRTMLVEHGILKGFLLGRAVVEGFEHSNGHGRAQGTRTPMGRMGVLMVRSAAAVSEQSLIERLLDEVKRQKKPFGLYIGEISGGSTNTSSYGYQAFKGKPRLVFKVDPETGKQTLVRGIEVVGTPLTTVSKIVAMGNRSEVFNGFCGAESGYVPVSMVAPAVLLTEIELQRDQRELGKAPLLVPPWELESSPRSAP